MSSQTARAAPLYYAAQEIKFELFPRLNVPTEEFFWLILSDKTSQARTTLHSKYFHVTISCIGMVLQLEVVSSNCEASKTYNQFAVCLTFWSGSQKVNLVRNCQTFMIWSSTVIIWMFQEVKLEYCLYNCNCICEYRSLQIFKFGLGFLISNAKQLIGFYG